MLFRRFPGSRPRWRLPSPPRLRPRPRLGMPTRGSSRWRATRSPGPASGGVRTSGVSATTASRRARPCPRQEDRSHDQRQRCQRGDPAATSEPGAHRGAGHDGRHQEEHRRHVIERRPGGEQGAGERGLGQDQREDHAQPSAPLVRHGPRTGPRHDAEADGHDDQCQGQPAVREGLRTRPDRSRPAPRVPAVRAVALRPAAPAAMRPGRDQQAEQRDHRDGGKQGDDPEGRRGQPTTELVGFEGERREERAAWPPRPRGAPGPTRCPPPARSLRSHRIGASIRRCVLSPRVS